MFARITMLLLGFSGLIFAQESYSYELQKGDTVSEIARLYTGKASIWRNPGVQVINHKTGKIYPKSEAHYRRLHVGDTVTISKTLTPTQSVSAYGLTIDQICTHFTTRDCTTRLSRINSKTPATPNSAVLIPTWFMPAPSTVNLNPPAPKPARPAANPESSPASGWLKNPKVLLAVIAIIAGIALAVFLSLRRKNQLLTFHSGPQSPYQHFFEELNNSLLAMGVNNFSIHRNDNQFEITFLEQDEPKVVKAVELCESITKLTAATERVRGLRIVLP